MTVNNREREVKKRKSGKAKASYKDKAGPHKKGTPSHKIPDSTWKEHIGIADSGSAVAENPGLPSSGISELVACGVCQG